MDKSTTQLIALQILSLAALLLGRVPKIGAVVTVLQSIVTEHWDEIWSIVQKTPAAQAALTNPKHEADPVAHLGK